MWYVEQILNLQFFSGRNRNSDVCMVSKAKFVIAPSTWPSNPSLSGRFFFLAQQWFKIKKRKSSPPNYLKLSALHTPHSRLLTLQSTLHTPHSTLYTSYSTLHTFHTFHTFHTLHSTLSTPHFTLHTLHFTLHTLHSTLHIAHFTLHTLHSTFYTPHFTLHTPHSTSTVNSACSYIRLHYVICIRVRWFIFVYSIHWVFTYTQVTVPLCPRVTSSSFEMYPIFNPSI